MPRPERPLDPSGPLSEFAQVLRDLRNQAGLTYGDMADRTGVSKTVLSQAAAGRRLPTWEATRAYVSACGENPDAWRSRWEQVEREWRATRPSTGPNAGGTDAAAPNQPTRGASARARPGARPSGRPDTAGGPSGAAGAAGASGAAGTAGASDALGVQRNTAEAANPPDNPAARLARDLGRLRRAAGRDFRDLANQLDRKPAELVAVVQGKVFPDWTLTKDFVQACRGSLPQWRQRWEQATRWRMRQRDGASPQRHQATSGQGDEPASSASTTSPARDEPDWPRRLAGVTSRSEFASVLRDLRQRSALTYGSIEQLSGLPTSTISDMLSARTLPSEATLGAFLKALGVAGSTTWRWMAARERVQMSRTVLPATATRVSSVHARTLGLHTAIQRHLEARMPSYIPRDVDDQLQEVVASASAGGGFVLVTGAAAAGKTRSAFEAVSHALPDWWLVRPYDVEQLVSFAKSPDQHTVVWLDELQRYGTDEGLPHAMRALLECEHPILLVGIVRLEQYQRYLAGNDHGREILQLGPDIVTVPQRLSPSERLRAEATSLDDPRVSTALMCGDHGTFQVLAAGPELVHRWKLASDRCGAALIAAAVDARRLGVTSGLPAQLLRDAAYGYLSRAERAADPDGWLPDALEYATTPLLSGVAALRRVATPHGTGYLVADYLVQHDLGLRPTVLPPDSAWQAYAQHLRAPEDLNALADAARGRGFEAYAEQLTRSAALSGHADAHRTLLNALEQQQRFDEAENLLRDVIAQQETEEASGPARVDLAEMLERHGRFGEAERELAVAVRVGTPGARHLLVRLLHRQDRLEEMEAAVREAVGSGEPGARFLLAYTLDAHGDRAEAERLLTEAVDADASGAPWAQGALARLRAHDRSDARATDASNPHPARAAHQARASGAAYEQSLTF